MQENETNQVHVDSPEHQQATLGVLTDSFVVPLVARICHEVNKAYCEGIGDFSQKPWDETTESIQASSLNGVVNAISGNATPEDSHNNWLEFKEKDGWVYGAHKDEEKKTHPCMVPYEDLPAEQKIKDHLFVQTANSAFQVISNLVLFNEFDYRGFTKHLEVRRSVQKILVWDNILIAMAENLLTPNADTAGLRKAISDLREFNKLATLPVVKVSTNTE